MNSNSSYDVIIVGAGLAGLACALRLRKKGKRVLVIEKNEKPGGKLSELKSMGFRFDQGPSLLTEPENLWELFELFEKNSNSYFDIIEHSESCRYFFDDQSSITLSSDLTKSKKEIRNCISEEESENYVEYLLNSKKDYSSVGEVFLNNPVPNILGFVHPRFIKNYPFLLSKKMTTSLSNYNSTKFKSEKMNLIFNRFGTYNGSNPYQMSGLYSMISNSELNDGTYFPKNGMRSIIDGLYKLSCEEGIDFKFNTTIEIEKIEDGFSYKFDNSNPERVKRVVCAMDHITFYDKVMKEPSDTEPFKKQERSSSGLIFYWGINTKIKEIGLHNIIFSNDYKSEFNSIFEARKNTKAPTIYIHNSSAICPEDAPINGQNLFIMINTSSYDAPDKAYIDEMKNYVILKIKEQFNIDITDHIVTEDYWDNSSIETLTGSYLGALYGASSNKMNSALKRHSNISKKYKNLYFCGGTVHPGGGIPLVLKSAKIVAKLIK